MMPPLFPLRNNVWEMTKEIPYWWRVTTQIWKWKVFAFLATATMFSSTKCINQIQGLFKTTIKIQDLFKIYELWW